MGAKGAGRLPPPDFFSLSYFENLTSVKISSHGFTHYLLWSLKNLPPLNFKLSPPLNRNSIGKSVHPRYKKRGLSVSTVIFRLSNRYLVKPILKETSR